MTSHIDRLIVELACEGCEAELRVSFHAATQTWGAKVVDVTHAHGCAALLDRDGDKFLFAQAPTSAEAIAKVNLLAARSGFGGR